MQSDEFLALCIWGGLRFSWYLGRKICIYVQVVIYKYNLTYITLSHLFRYYPFWLCEITLKCFSSYLIPFLSFTIWFSGILLLSVSMCTNTYTHTSYLTCPFKGYSEFPASIGEQSTSLLCFPCPLPLWALSDASFLASQGKKHVHSAL